MDVSGNSITFYSDKVMISSAEEAPVGSLDAIMPGERVRMVFRLSVDVNNPSKIFELVLERLKATKDIAYAHNLAELSFSFDYAEGELPLIFKKANVVKYFPKKPSFGPPELITNISRYFEVANNEAHIAFLTRLQLTLNIGLRFFTGVKQTPCVLSYSPTIGGLIESAYFRYPGMIIGEKRDAREGIYLVTHWMQEFISAGVRTIYIDGLPYDTLQKWMDRYVVEKKEMSFRLKEWIETEHPQGEAVKKLLKEAKRFRVRVVALDNSLSLADTSHLGVDSKDSHWMRVVLKTTLAYSIIQAECPKDEDYVVVTSRDLLAPSKIRSLQDILQIPSVVVDDKLEIANTLNTTKYPGLPFISAALSFPLPPSY